MTADRSVVAEVAAELRDVERSGTALALVTERLDDIDWHTARAIARARDALRVADGDELIGYKLGWTSAQMRAALGIDRPNWGTLWSSQRLGRTLDLGPLRHPKVEPEIVYVADRELVGPDVSSQDVIRRARGWAVGIEVVHPRWPSYDFTWLDNTADNSSAHAVTFGDVERHDGDIAAVSVEFTDRTEHRTGRGDRAMGSPAEAVAWLVRSLAAEDRGLEPGQIVFTGGLTAPFDVVDGGRYTLRSPQLGSIGLDATDVPEGS